MAVVNTARPNVTLTTDLGLEDNYVGIVKGVITALNHRAHIIDISHTVPPFAVTAGRYLLETAYRSFPPGTVHVAVVDPGVGTARDAVVIETDDYFFVGPDNGLFSFLAKGDISGVTAITRRKYLAREITPTFHGRDIFAPVAGFLTLGIAPAEFGPPRKSLVDLPSARTRMKNGDFIGGVIYIDHFGNLVTSLQGELLPAADLLVFVNDIQVGRLRKTFGSVPVGRPVCYVNSFGYVEIAVREGSAARHFGVDYDSKAQILIAPL
ncbi:MAG: SAM-dependent chlorinase/fluorinase [Candidatus Zixiibacteriota bacterium]|nr:MAG: SAM-dependent chlorinase/fluorinase [candidate division Zixibacteria bacterium]